jgi:hypothetical protein
VKVIKRVSIDRAVLGAALIVMLAAVMSLSSPTQGHAITRTKIMKRAKHWVHKRVRYSQSGYYKGYRRDCSGFVSMAWGLKKSYTTRTISKRAKRIRISSLKPGDAVLTRGHVTIFGGWKSKKHRTYWALEETTWGSHAKRRVRKIPHGAKALRRKGLRRPRRIAPRAPSRRIAPPISTPTTDTTAPPSADTTGTVGTTATAEPQTAAGLSASIAPVAWNSERIAVPMDPLIASLVGSNVVAPRFVV